jgi:hypothetical protein
MSDLIYRAQKAKSLASDPSLPQCERLLQGLQAFSGLLLTGLSPGVREELEADLVGVNQILAGYPLEKGEDYRRVGAVDLQQMLRTVDIAASGAIAAELDRIVASLDAGSEKLPVEAIQEARGHRDLMVPRLIEVLREATAAARAGNVPEGNAHFFAIFLLTEFQAEEALPIILEAFSLPGELPFDLFGEAVTSTLPRILARFAGDRPDVMDAMVNDSALNEYVRWQGAQCYVHLVRDGRLSRDDAVRRLQRLLRQAIDRGDETVVGGLICVLTSFAPEEAMAEIREAYQRDLVDSVLVNLSTVERSIAEGETRVREELESCPPTGIDDTIEELRHWAAFQEKPAQRRATRSPVPHLATGLEPAELATAAGTSRRPRVGRNEPCPCGSGKKFKRCCGSRT